MHKLKPQNNNKRGKSPSNCFCCIGSLINKIFLLFQKLLKHQNRRGKKFKQYLKKKKKN